jgi:hypothetical protein
MRLPEKCLEWRAGAWTFGITLCPGTSAVIVFWDGNPYGLAVVLPFVRFWCERDGGSYWPWEWTILHYHRQAGVPGRSGAELLGRRR